MCNKSVTTITQSEADMGHKCSISTQLQSGITSEDGTGVQNKPQGHLPRADQSPDYSDTGPTVTVSANNRREVNL